jgi:predicted RNase H-like HicB family nuclease
VFRRLKGRDLKVPLPPICAVQDCSKPEGWLEPTTVSPGSERRYDLAMISQYLSAALGKARYEILTDDGSYYGDIEGFEGVYANAGTLESCREELREVLEEWILFRVSRNLPLPVVDGHELIIKAFA